MTTGTTINWIIDSAGENLISQPPGYTIFLVHHGSLVECTVFYQHEQIGNKVKSLAKAKRAACGGGAPVNPLLILATALLISGPAVVLDGDTVVVAGVHIRLKRR
jgi:hypothetical protein